jgi:hypothetical protein
MKDAIILSLTDENDCAPCVDQFAGGGVGLFVGGQLYLFFHIVEDNLYFQSAAQSLSIALYV